MDKGYKEYAKRSAKRHNRKSEYDTWVEKRNQLLERARHRDMLKCAFIGGVLGLIVGIWAGIAFFGV